MNYLFVAEQCVFVDTNIVSAWTISGQEDKISWNECREFCKKDTKCNAWSYTANIGHEGQCVKKKEGYKAGLKFDKKGIYSGAKECGEGNLIHDL